MRSIRDQDIARQLQPTLDRCEDDGRRSVAKHSPDEGTERAADRRGRERGANPDIALRSPRIAAARVNSLAPNGHIARGDQADYRASGHSDSSAEQGAMSGDNCGCG
jgi:hypothetical protein